MFSLMMAKKEKKVTKLNFILFLFYRFLALESLHTWEINFVHNKSCNYRNTQKYKIKMQKSCFNCFIFVSTAKIVQQVFEIKKFSLAIPTPI